MTYLFTVCEYGGGEVASCRLTCGEEFADGYEVGLRMRVDEESYYIVREELDECGVAEDQATVEPWFVAI